MLLDHKKIKFGTQTNKDIPTIYSLMRQKLIKRLMV